MSLLDSCGAFRFRTTLHFKSIYKDGADNSTKKKFILLSCLLWLYLRNNSYCR